MFPRKLRLTLASTNVIESAFAIVERVCLNVKRWHAGEQRERWVGSAIGCRKAVRRVKGINKFHFSSEKLDALIPSKSYLVKKRRAS